MEGAGRRRLFDCGLFQIFNTLLLSLLRFATGWSLLFMSFGNYNQGWTCVRYPNNTNANNVSNSAGFDPEHMARDCENFTNCASPFMTPKFKNSNSGLPYYNVHNNDNLFKDSNLSVHSNTDGLKSMNDTILTFSFINESSHDNADLCDFIHTCDAIEFHYGSRTLVSDFNLICDNSRIPNIIIFIQLLGTVVGTIISGYCGDRFGRKVTHVGFTVLNAVCSFLAIFSPAWQVYAVFSFFLGAGAMGITAVNAVLMMEFLNVKWRARVMGIPSFSLAVTSFYLFVFIFRDWVHVHLVTASIYTVALIGLLWTPESLRWLVLHGKEKLVEKTIKKIAKNNRILNEINLTDVKVDLLRQCKSEESTRNHNYLDLVRTRESRWRTIKTSWMSFSAILSYYTLSYSVKAMAGDFYMNGLISGMVEVPIVLSIFIANPLGRRSLVGLFFVLTAIGCTIVLIAQYTLNDDVGGTVTTYTLIFTKASSVANYLSLMLFVVELFPTAVRSLGLAVVITVGRIGLLIGPFLIPDDKSTTILCFLILGLFAVISVCINFTLPETKNYDLQDTLKVECENESEIAIQDGTDIQMLGTDANDVEGC